MVIKTCELTNRKFNITEEEIKLYSNFNIQEPSLCPEERYRALLMFYPTNKLYKRTCALSSNSIYSYYPDFNNIPVISFEVWNNPSLDFTSYGIDYDETQDFFELLKSLWLKTPRPAVTMDNVVEVRGAQSAFNVKDSFLVFDIHNSSKCAYSVGVWNCFKVIDCNNVYNSKLCYECVNCFNCELLRYSLNCKNCVNSYFLDNCDSCKDCLFCSNLVNKKYYVFNRKVTKKEYESLLDKWQFFSRSKVEEAKIRFNEFLLKEPCPHIIADSSSHIMGNYIANSNYAINAFECINCNNVYNSRNLIGATNTVDGIGYGDRVNNCIKFINIGNNATNVLSSIECYNNVNNIFYSVHCENSSNLFACVGLKNKEFCILNKQYTKSKYEKKILKIINDLKRTGTWGSFFPPHMSPFPYNGSRANDRMPLSKVQSKLFGFLWDDRIENNTLASSLVSQSDISLTERFREVPELLLQVDTSVIKNQMYLCEITGTPFQFNAQELELYEEINVALPARCFSQRHRERRALLASDGLEKRDIEGTLFFTSFKKDFKRKVVSYNDWFRYREELNREK